MCEVADKSYRPRRVPAFEQLRRGAGPSWQTLLGGDDAAAFQKLYPFSPALVDVLVALRKEDRPNHADAPRFAESRARGRLSKFQPCLPERLEAEYLAELLTDAGEA